MAIIRVILFPFSILYGFITFVRNKLYDWGVFRSVRFNKAVISVGNLSAGGTGKTPHVEYIIRLLHSNFRVATLSRGYKRDTYGYRKAGAQETAQTLGDEPYQFWSKFKDIQVAVDGDRVRGVKTLLQGDSDLQVIILDDAFQHRRVRPGYSILLTDFYNLYSKDRMLPFGRLREYRTGAKRADMLVVTKSPEVLSPITRRRVEESLKPSGNQVLCFSYIRHGSFTRIPGVEFDPAGMDPPTAILLVAAIANPYPLEAYLTKKCNQFHKLYFPDHHNFKSSDIDRMVSAFEKLFVKNKIIATTEKDMTRLIHPEILVKIRDLPICYIPMEVRFHEGDRQTFENQLMSYVKNH